MDRESFLRSLLKEGQELEIVEPDLFSAIGAGAEEGSYDQKAWFYDWVIGNCLYNRVMWGNSPANYSSFCKQALANPHREGVVLDAGCGTLVFTGRVYARHSGPLILLDRSLGMLRRARRRLVRAAGRVPDQVVLVQGDVFQLPFGAGSIDTVLSFGMLHLFERKVDMVRELQRVLTPEGTAHLTSLTADRWLGRWYHRMLHRAGEMAAPMRGAELQELLGEVLSPLGLRVTGNMAYLSRVPQTVDDGS